MIQENEQLDKVLQKFPDQNPNPVLRFSDKGVLQYYNSPSEPIIDAWKININDKPNKEFLDKLKITLAENENSFEINVDSKSFLLKAVYIKELSSINVYGTDITAKKAIDKFPDQNPNPVMRISKEGILNYYNKASYDIVNSHNLKTGEVISDNLIELVSKTILTNSITQNELTAGNKTYLANFVPVQEFGFIIIYATDITAKKVINKFPDKNPNPVMKLGQNGELKYFNDASKYIIQNWDIGLNDTIPKEIIKNLTKQNTKDVHNMEFEVGNKTYYLNLVKINEFDFFLLYGTDITDTKDKEMILTKLSKYFSPQVYNSIFTGELDVKIDTNRKNLTVFFSDIKGFTTITEKLEPEILTELITYYLTEMTNIAIEYGGTVDKYIGDAIMIFFGDPKTDGITKDAVSCVSMALKMKRKLKAIRKRWISFGLTESLDVRMGIHTDVCTVGNFGSHDRLDYTVLGNGVNIASRLESLAKPNEILISENTFNIIRNDIECIYADEIIVKGKSHPIKTFQVQNLISKKDRRETIEYETDGFSLMLDKEQIKNTEKIISYLKNSLDHLKD
ncbi:MAG: adenylate/guanylate cyclase domain-containing protein [Candidatus Marinimicrobia bacterium]|nr:adenylate/guanylate cyclase domain-containing protein [Candidatus Neomarinimicrobiota bacterium]MBT6413451.1 adenylate/guanylate cyclase domain-containing protein [Candidatus Neomarinimicrobiota bacterium]MBT7042392.1 adenylate/guanylate cyclase domain-containing protein [Candidatus Neomarinimicrobiota bacterium]